MSTLKEIKDYIMANLEIWPSDKCRFVGVEPDGEIRFDNGLGMSGENEETFFDFYPDEPLVIGMNHLLESGGYGAKYMDKGEFEECKNEA